MAYWFWLSVFWGTINLSDPVFIKSNPRSHPLRQSSYDQATTCYFSVNHACTRIGMPLFHIFLGLPVYLLFGLVIGDYWLRHICVFTWSNSAPTGRIFMKFDIWGIFKNLSRKCKCPWNVTRVSGTLHADHMNMYGVAHEMSYHWLCT